MKKTISILMALMIFMSVFFNGNTLKATDEIFVKIGDDVIEDYTVSGNYDDYLNMPSAFGVGDSYNINIREISNGYRVKVGNYTYYGAFSIMRNDVENKDVFCIDVATGITSGGGYVAFNYLEVLSDPILWDDLNIIGTYAQLLHQQTGDDTYYIAGQLMQWKRQGASEAVYTQGYGQFNAVINIDYYINMINSRMQKHFMNPSFNQSNITLKVGESITLTDTNNVFDEYTVKTTNGLNVVKNGNSITITATKDSQDGFIEFFKNENLVAPSLAYKKSGSQNMASYGFIDPIKATINMTILKQGNLQIIKQDVKNNLVPNTKFKVFKDSGLSDLLGEYTTDSNGQILIKDLDLGIYYIQETYVPSPYVKESSVVPFEVKPNETVTFVKTNDIVKGYIELLKKEDEKSPQYQDKVIANATYDLLDINKKFIKSYTTNDKGIIQTDLLDLGTYYLKESKAPTGYNSDPVEYKVDVVYQDMNTPVTVTKLTVKDVVISGKGHAVKTTNGLSFLDGAKIGLYDENDNLLQTLTSGSFALGQARTIDLRYGRYYFQEIESPKGYYLNTNKHWFTIDEQNEIEYVAINNDLVKAKIKFLKVDSETQLPIENACFGLYKNGVRIGLEVNDNGKVTTKDLFCSNSFGEVFIDSYLLDGTYVLKEESVPSGYNKMNDLTFVISKDSPIEDLGVVGYVLDLGMVENTPMETYFIKLDEDTMLPLENAKFRLTHESGITHEFVSTLDKVTLKYLPFGKYTIEEIETPKGYVTMKPYSFELTQEGQTIILNNKQTQVEIIKLDKETEIELEGVELEILTLDGVSITKFTTTDVSTVFSGLPIGKYILRENKALNGYITALDMIIEVIDKEGMQSFTMYNEKTKVQFIKQNIDTKEVLNGGKYNIYKLNEIQSNIQEQDLESFEDLDMFSLDSVKTTYKNLGDDVIVINGKYYEKVLKTLIDNKIDGNYLTGYDLGIYLIEEIETPIGYEFNIPRLFEIKDSHETSLAVHEDSIKLYDPRVLKVDSVTKEGIEGAVFELLDENKNVIDTATSDKEGVAQFKVKVPFGMYYIQETKAPEGYIKSKEVIRFVIDGTKESSFVYEFTITNTKQPLPKTGIQSNITEYAYIVMIGGML